MSSASVSGTGTSAADSAKRDSSNVSNHCDGEVQRSEEDEDEEPSLFKFQSITSLFYRVSHKFRLTKQEDYFRVNFNHFRGSWGSIGNWLELETKPCTIKSKCSMSKSIKLHLFAFIRINPVILPI